MADTPSWAGPVPVLFSGAWQKKQFNAGLPGGIDETVRTALANPLEPATLITVPTFGDLPEVGALGQAYKVADTGKRYVWGGYAYDEVKRLDGSSYE